MIATENIGRYCEDAGYAEVAAERDTATLKVVARRRRPTWEDEP